MTGCFRTAAMIFSSPPQFGQCSVPQGPDEDAELAKPAECEANCEQHRPVRRSWARLLKRVFELDLVHSVAVWRGVCPITS
jgi:hypothetical protein